MYLNHCIATEALGKDLQKGKKKKIFTGWFPTPSDGSRQGGEGKRKGDRAQPLGRKAV